MATHEIPMIEEHGLDVDVAIFDHLLLPSQDELKQLDYVESYLKNRFKGPSPIAIIGDPASANSLDVKYAMANSAMNNVRAMILSTAERMKQLKLQEVQKAWSEYQRLKAEADSRSCKFHYQLVFPLYARAHYVSVHSQPCQKCDFQRQADMISVDCYQWPLPPTTEGEFAVVFELGCPNSVRVLRNAIVFMKTIVLNSIINSHTTVRDLWAEHRSFSMHKASNYPTRDSDQVKLMNSRQFCHKRKMHHPSYSPSGHKFILPNTEELHLGHNWRLLAPSSDYFRNEKYVDKLREKCLPKLTGVYKVLQWTIDSNTHSDNQVICRQHECPKDLSLREFRTFGCMRAGGRIQLRNLVAAIKSDELSWHHEDVLMLISQTVWETGTRSNAARVFVTDQRYSLDTLGSTVNFEKPNLREQHQDFECNEFSDDVLRILEEKLMSILDNWEKNISLLCLVVFGCRLLEFCHENQNEKFSQFVLRCRSVGMSWIRKVRTKIGALQVKNKQVRELREKLIQIGLTVAVTYNVSYCNIQYVLRNPDHALNWLIAQNTVSDNWTLANEAFQTSKLITNLTQNSWQAGLRIEAALSTIIMQQVDVVQKFVSSQYAYEGITAHACENSRWNRVPEASPWMKKDLSHGSHMCLNILTGAFLVNNGPVCRLPSDITSHECYKRLFGPVNMTVAPGQCPKSYVTVNKIEGCFYELQMIDKSCLLIIKKTHSETFFYLPKAVLEKDIPHELGEYSHWLLQNTCSDRSSKIEFHEKRLCEKQTNELQRYEMRKIENGFWNLFREQDQSVMLGMQSKTVRKFTTEIFNRIEKDEHIHFFLLRESSNISISVPRHRLSFIAQKPENEVFSVEFPTFRIAHSHSIGTLIGLESCLVLESETSKKMIIPHGDLDERLQFNHASIHINLTKFYFPSFFVYSLDENLCQLSPPASQVANLFLALLHAKTSFPVEDPFTKLTGFEVALYTTRGGRSLSYKPLDQRAIQILAQLKNCCPVRSLLIDGIKVEKEIYPKVPQYSLCTLETLSFACTDICHQSQKLQFMNVNNQVGGELSSVYGTNSFWLQMLSYNRLKNHVNPFNLPYELSYSFRVTNPQVVLKSECLLNNVRIIATLFDIDVSESLYSSSHSLSSWAKSQSMLLGRGQSKLVSFPRLEVLKTVNVKYESLLDLYDIARRGEETREWLFTLMSFWAFEGKMGLDDMAPFFVISKHSELFQDINPPKYTEYEDLPNDDVELSEVVQYIEGLMKPFELYLNSWIKKLDNRNAEYEFEEEEAAARKKYDLLYRDEKKTRC